MPSEPLSQAQAWAHVSPMPCLKVCTLLLLVQLSPICAAIEANPIRPITFFPVTRVQFVCRVPAVNAWDCLQLNHLRCMSRIQTSTGNTGLSLKWQNPSLLLDMSNSTTVNQPPTPGGPFWAGPSTSMQSATKKVNLEMPVSSASCCSMTWRWETWETWEAWNSTESPFLSSSTSFPAPGHNNNSTWLSRLKAKQRLLSGLEWPQVDVHNKLQDPGFYKRNNITDIKT